jgi:hypothetical protein
LFLIRRCYTVFTYLLQLGDNKPSETCIAATKSMPTTIVLVLLPHICRVFLLYLIGLLWFKTSRTIVIKMLYGALSTTARLAHLCHEQVHVLEVPVTSFGSRLSGANTAAAACR